jgi:hypothetical protein
VAFKTNLRGNSFKNIYESQISFTRGGKFIEVKTKSKYQIKSILQDDNLTEISILASYFGG